MTIHRVFITADRNAVVALAPFSGYPRPVSPLKPRYAGFAEPSNGILTLDQVSNGPTRVVEGGGYWIAMADKRRRTVVGTVIAMIVSIVLAGCSSLPEDGPSARQVSSHNKESAKARYVLLDVDYRIVQTIGAHPSEPLASLRGSPEAGDSDLIAVGDALSISIFQPLQGFTPQSGPTTEGGVTDQQTLPRLVVDRTGTITVPFAGEVAVADLTPEQASAAVRRALRRKLANPQVIVTLVSSPRNSVIVIGEVKSPGRFPLVANSDKLLDAIAAAGGPTKPARDLSLTVVRGGQSATISVETLLQDPAENIRLSPQDQIRVLPAPRKIDVFGAVGKGAEVPIEADTLTLAGALGRIGGLNGQAADARSVLVYRIERPEIAKALGVDFPSLPGLTGVPIIYRVNLRDPSGYFVANKFEVVANDLIYVPTADVAELQKFLQVVNSAAQFFYDAAVAKTL
jgi:polysaccharide export outer membrane protein